MMINPTGDEIYETVASSHRMAAEVNTVDGWTDHVRNAIAALLANLMLEFPDVRRGLFGDQNTGVGLTHDRTDTGGMTVFPVDVTGRAVCGLNLRVTVSAAPCDCPHEEEGPKHAKEESTGRPLTLGELLQLVSGMSADEANRFFRSQN